MFGYIKIDKEELKLKEYRVYRSYYCALCKQISMYSQLHRLMLSYDFTFLSMLVNADVNKVFECKKQKSGKCHGSSVCFGKCNGDEKLKFISAFSVIMQYLKVKDDVIDGNAGRKLLLLLLKNGYNKAKNDYPALSKLAETQMAKLLELEKANCGDLEMLESCFADIFKEGILQIQSMDDQTRDICSKIAYHISAWVYLIDMFDDIDKDIKNNDFNPLKHIEREKAKGIILEKTISHLETALKLSKVLPYSDTTPIINNLLNFGLPKEMARVGLIRRN